jgi:hypothetical protein
VAARFWLYQRREPYSLIYWGITAVIMAVVAIRAVLTPDWFSGLLACGAAGGAFVGAFHSNAIGWSVPVARQRGQELLRHLHRRGAQPVPHPAPLTRLGPYQASVGQQR